MEQEKYLIPIYFFNLFRLLGIFDVRILEWCLQNILLVGAGLVGGAGGCW